MYLIDTNVCIKAIAGIEPDAAFFAKAIQQNSAALSVISVAEFLSKASQEEQKVMNELISVFPVLEIKISTSQIAAKFRRESKKEKRVALLDCFLAAQAVEYNLTLVTNNITDFPRKGLKIIMP